VLRSLLFDLFSFTAFFAVAALTIIPLGSAAGLFLATVASLLSQGVALAALRHAL